MNKVQIKARKGFADSLRPLAFRLRAYLDANPLADGVDLLVEIAQCEGAGDEFSYDWVDTSVDEIARCGWQAMLDCWLKKNFHAKLPPGINQLLFRILKMEHRANAADAGDSSSGLIAGDGLAEFSSTEPRFSLDDLIGPKELKDALLSAVAMIANIDLIYNQWGFSAVDPVPRAILNFYGPPGTGKTMAAHGIANALDSKIIIANFAEIESKYVGDSPKNLENIFRQAENDDAVLFFDEADSFLGKRLTSISSSSDQAVNSLRSKLLQLLEDHKGVVVFCTNLFRNYDKAFESRILKNVRFDLPDFETRKKLIRQKIPFKLPFAPGQVLDDAALSGLAGICDGFSGRDIKNAVLKTLSFGAMRGVREFTISDIRFGFEDMKAEMEKLRTERGEFSQARKDALSKEISNNLASGDYAKTNIR